MSTGQSGVGNSSIEVPASPMTNLNPVNKTNYYQQKYISKLKVRDTDPA